MVLVLNLLRAAIMYKRKHLGPANHPQISVWTYGTSYMLAWIAILIYVGAGIAFVCCSRKRKHRFLGTLDEEWGVDDERPQILGR